MDVIGGVASISQVIAYGHVVIHQLVQLYKAAQEGPHFCQVQHFNISVLLESVQRICTNETLNIDSILPLLIDTTELACSLLNWLKPKGTLYNKWLWISKSRDIESSFRALNDKTRLLQFHITERTYTIVSHVQKDIEHMNQTMYSCLSEEKQVVVSIHQHS